MRFYFYDASENVSNRSDLLYLHGLEKQDNGKFKSCCVVVKHCYRLIYIESNLDLTIEENFEITKQFILDQAQKSNYTDLEFSLVHKKLLSNCEQKDLCNQKVALMQIKCLIKPKNAFFNLKMTKSALKDNSIKQIHFGPDSPIENFLLQKSIGACNWLLIANKNIDKIRFYDSKEKFPFQCEKIIEIDNIDIIQPLENCSDEPLFKIASIHTTFNTLNKTDEYSEGEHKSFDNNQEYYLKHFSCIIHNNVNIALTEHSFENKKSQSYKLYHYTVLNHEESLAYDSFQDYFKNIFVENRQYYNQKAIKGRKNDIQILSINSKLCKKDIDVEQIDKDDTFECKVFDKEKVKQEFNKNRRLLYKKIQDLIRDEDPDIILNHGFYTKTANFMIFENQNNRFSKLRNVFQRKTENISKLNESDLYNSNEKIIQMGGRLVFDSQILLETIIKDSISKNIRSDSLQEIAEAYKCISMEHDSEKNYNSRYKNPILKLNRKQLYSFDKLPDYFETLKDACNIDISKKVKDSSYTTKDSDIAKKRNFDSCVEHFEFDQSAKLQIASALECQKKKSKCQYVDYSQYEEERFYLICKNQESFNYFIQNHINACQVQSSLCFKLSIFTFSRELTRKSGNLWSSNLTRTTSNPIEYTIMHNLYLNGFIIEKEKSSREKRAETLHSDENDEHKINYSGGKILDIEKKEYSDGLVFLVDVSSMYATAFMKYDLCITNPLEFNFQEETEKNDKKNNTGKEKVFGLATKSVTKVSQFVIPNLISELVSKRKKIQKQSLKLKKRLEELQQKNDNIENEKNDFLKQLKICESQEKVYKLITNKCYGCIGFKNFRFSDLRVASRVTECGRSILQWLIKCVEEYKHFNFEIIYGHTDSLMLYKKFESTDTVDSVVKEFMKIFNYINSKDKYINIKLEGVYRKMILTGKNKYFGLEIKDIEFYQSQIDQLKHKDNPFVKDLYNIYRFKIKGCEINNRQYSFFSQQFCVYILHQWLFTNACFSNINELSVVIDKKKSETKFKRDINFFINTVFSFMFDGENNDLAVNNTEILSNSINEDASVNCTIITDWIKNIANGQMPYNQLKYLLNQFSRVNTLRISYDKYKSKTEYHMLAIEKVKTFKQRYTHNKAKIEYIFCNDIYGDKNTFPLILYEYLNDYMSFLNSKLKNSENNTHTEKNISINLYWYLTKSICDIYSKTFSYCFDNGDLDKKHALWSIDNNLFKQILEKHRKVKIQFEHQNQTSKKRKHDNAFIDNEQQEKPSNGYNHFTLSGIFDKTKIYKQSGEAESLCKVRSYISPDNLWSVPFNFINNKGEGLNSPLKDGLESNKTDKDSKKTIKIVNIVDNNKNIKNDYKCDDHNDNTNDKSLNNMQIDDELDETKQKEKKRKILQIKSFL